MDHHKTEPIAGIEMPATGTDRRLSFAVSMANLDAEKVLSAFGKYGNYQMMAYILVNSVAILYSSQMMIMGFIANPPQFECNIQQPEQASKWMMAYILVNSVAILYSSQMMIMGFIANPPQFECNIQQPEHASKWFDLVCRDEHWAQHASSLFMLGAFSTLFNALVNSYMLLLDETINTKNGMQHYKKYNYTTKNNTM
ncbi:hypothetical protein Tcan_18714 [Toxocara canis]|uniref:Uncharacterized protein n=1 Tax=Toxocara canis TaxID=6265 RepID=A0A0B2UY85_TOXCA|nr:hypothetical protein Tcan_18714 [Toxocara canis]